MNPLYHLVDEAGAGLSRACADDVACLRSAKLAANLCVQPTKCILNPLGRRCNAATVALVKQFILSIAPKWASFQISSAGVYLGVRVGPGAHDAAWDATTQKLVGRVAAIAGGRHSPAVGAALYARTAIPMVHHIAQLCLPPAHVGRPDLRLPARVLHLPGSPMPTKLLLRLQEFGGPRTPSIVAAMIASYVRFALSPMTDLSSALRCCDEDPDSLPLAWRRYDSPRHWAGHCMAGALQRTDAGDVGLWPTALRLAVADAVNAARAALENGRARGLQAAAYSAAHARLFAGDLVALLAPRLAKELGAPREHDVVSGVIRGLSALDVRASLLAVRGATNAVCTGARMQTVGAVCRFCGEGPDSIQHYPACPTALRLFSAALRRPTAPSIIHLLEADPPAVARTWAAFINFVSVAVATERERGCRAKRFVPAGCRECARPRSPR